MNICEKLQKIQGDLDVPKSQYNIFGKYNYRSCEDILAAAKPLCNLHNCVLTLSDDAVEVAGRHYVKATARLTDVGELTTVEVTAFAREDEIIKGMSAAQITGAASSYARKYALNGLFCLDDVKDADSTNTHGKDEPVSYNAAKKVFRQDMEFDPEEMEQPLVCSNCSADITQGVSTVSIKNYGRPLCPKCQKEEGK